MARQRPFHRSLAFWVLLALGLGAAFRAILPEDGARLRVLPDLFLSVMTMFIAPLVFTTVVGAIAVLGDFRRFGRLSAGVPLLGRPRLRGRTAGASATPRSCRHELDPGPGNRPRRRNRPTDVGGTCRDQPDGDRLRHTLAASLTVDPDRPGDDPSVVKTEISR
ncbi:cation:dicarboxylate symporter family transporter [Streptomyces swartbergensis]